MENDDLLRMVQIDDCEWYHQTNARAASSILKEGFAVEHGGDQRFTEGVYFLSRKGAHYGDVTVKACISGNFLEVRNFPFDDWHEVKSHYYEKIKGENMPFNYEILTNFMKKDNPKADGIVFTEDNGKLNHMIVVWNPSKSISKDTLTIVD